jgi:hypothetical protein
MRYGTYRILGAGWENYTERRNPQSEKGRQRRLAIALGWVGRLGGHPGGGRGEGEAGLLGSSFTVPDSLIPDPDPAI